MGVHLYRVGQSVAIRELLPDRTRGGLFEVVRLMPASVDGELHYRVRGTGQIERAVGESQLSPATSA